MQICGKRRVLVITFPEYFQLGFGHAEAVITNAPAAISLFVCTVVRDVRMVPDAPVRLPLAEFRGIMVSAGFLADRVFPVLLW